MSTTADWNPRTVLERAPTLAVDALLGVFGLFHAFAIAAVYLRWSYDTLFPLALLSLVGLALPVLTRPWETASRPEHTSDAPWAAVGVAMLVGLAAVYGLARGQFVWLAFAVMPLAVIYAATARPFAAPLDLRARPVDLGAVLVVGLGGALLTLLLCRADVDDGYYVSAVLQTLEQSARPVLGFDTIHGDPDAPLQQVIHRPQTYEVLVATVSKASGVAPRTMYWLVLPFFFGGCAALAQWALAKALEPRLAWLAVLFAFGMLVCWGDGDKTIGRFGFARLYHGKAVFVTVMAPMLTYAALRWVDQPDWRSGLRLAVGGFGATLFTSTALVVAPLLVGMAVLAGLQPSKKSLRDTVLGVATTLPVLFVLGLVWLEVQGSGGLTTEGKPEGPHSVLGARRAPIVVFTLAAVPFLMRGTGGAAWVGRFVVIATLLVLNGSTGQLLGAKAAGLLNWRAFWAVPFPTLLAVGIASGLVAAVRGVRERSLTDAARVVFAVVAIGAFASVKRTALYDDDIAHRFGKLDVRPGHEAVANAVMRLSTPDTVVAAPPFVSQALAMRRKKPKLVGVWYRYINNLNRYWGTEEGNRRVNIVKFARGHIHLVPRKDLDAQCVTLLVTMVKHRGKGNAETVFPTMGFERAGRANSHEIWVRDAPPGCE